MIIVLRVHSIHAYSKLTGSYSLYRELYDENRAPWFEGAVTLVLL